MDILVKVGRNFARVVKAIRTLYPQLEVRVFTGVTGFFLPGEKWSVINVIYPHRADLEETLAGEPQLLLRFRFSGPSANGLILKSPDAIPAQR